MVVDTIMNRNDVALDTLAREEVRARPGHARLPVGRGGLLRSSRSCSVLCCR